MSINVCISKHNIVYRLVYLIALMPIDLDKPKIIFRLDPTFVL